MIKKTGFSISLVILALLIINSGTGCQIWEMDADVQQEQVILEEEGVLTGQIDSQSVEIEVDGQPRAFVLAEGVSVTDISDGSPVNFTYVEEEDRPVLYSIEAVKIEEDILHGEGIYNGQIDSNSVEIETDGQPTAFALGEEVSVDDIEEGSFVAYTYREEDYRPVLKSIEAVEEPAGEGDGILLGEGTMVGLTDSRSVEIDINRAFMLGEEVSVDDIEDGSKVAFTYTETGHRAVIESIEAVDEPIEGEVMHGTLVGQIDAQSVEIRYFQTFTLGEDIEAEDITDGAEIFFTYSIDNYRPVLKSVTYK